MQGQDWACPIIKLLIRKTVTYILLLCPSVLLGQAGFLPSGNDTHGFIERMEVISGINATQLHTSLKPFNRRAVVAMAEHLDTTLTTLTDIDRHLMQLLLQSHPEWATAPSDSTPGRGGWLCSHIPPMAHVYAYPSHFYRYHSDGFFVSANPVLHLQLGREHGMDKPLFLNTRGMELRGMISGRVGFYTFVAENQARLPAYVDAHRHAFFSGSIPGEGWAKGFKEGGVDYFTARGYVALQATEHIALQFGQDRGSIGHGIRSLLLSDAANNYLFLKIDTRYRWFHYQNTWARLTDYPLRSFGSRAYDPKYSVTHHLSVQLGRRLQVGLFENVTMGRSDPSGHRGLDPHYLNPLIFYRAIEHHVGDADKVTIGLDWRWIMRPGVSLYGQMLINEFRISDIRNDLDSMLVRTGLRKERQRSGFASFANKFGIQGGMRLADPFGIQNLDIQAEVNLLRPYVYSHYDVSEQNIRPGASYSHYSQPLGHPLGANLREWAMQAQYKVHPRIIFTVHYINYIQGRDTDGLNYGGNILKDYRLNRPHPESAYFLDGQAVQVQLAELIAGWQFWPGWHLEGRYITRSESVNSTVTNTNMILVGLRVNAVGRRDYF